VSRRRTLDRRRETFTDHAQGSDLCAELIVPWLPGYENSSPVRIGNGAHEQLQLDVFGETADAIFQALKAGTSWGRCC
jgi:GH15 family glucan-1,4-alpha-glucosidase